MEELKHLCKERTPCFKKKVVRKTKAKPVKLNKIKFYLKYKQVLFEKLKKDPDHPHDTIKKSRFFLEAKNLKTMVSNS